MASIVYLLPFLMQMPVTPPQSPQPTAQYSSESHMSFDTESVNQQKLTSLRSSFSEPAEIHFPKKSQIQNVYSPNSYYVRAST